MTVPVVIAEIERSGFVEGRHYGSLVALGPEGEIEWSVGDVTSPILPRSCNKPMQAVGMVEQGLQLDARLLALVCSSHSAESFHLEGVRRILAGVELDESALQTPADYPLTEDVREMWKRGGGQPKPILMDCSGKHAGMIATCVTRGWDPTSYLDPGHPLQRDLRDTFERLTGEKVERLAIDGCGAPIFPTSLTGLARAMRRLAVADSGPEHEVAAAIRRFPSMVSGTDRDERKLIEAIPGAIAKAGAEGVYVVALRDGRAWALKVDDGAARARPVVMAEALLRSGVLDEPGVDAAEVAATGQSVVLGGGHPVGRIRAAFWPGLARCG